MAGLTAVFRGCAFLVRHRGLWKFAVVPVIVFCVVLFGLGSLAIFGTNALVNAVQHQQDMHTVTAWALRILLWVLSTVISFLVATALAQPLSGFALDALSQRQERELGGPSRAGPPLVAAILNSIKVTFLGLLVGIPLLVTLAALTLVVPPLAVVTVPLKLCVVAMLAVWDFLDYPLSLRHMGIRDRLHFCRTHRTGLLGFGFTWVLLFLVPGVGLLLLPVGVVASTRLVVATERPLPV